jgi:hypothetical protein
MWEICWVRPDGYTQRCLRDGSWYRGGGRDYLAKYHPERLQKNMRGTTERLEVIAVLLQDGWEPYAYHNGVHCFRRQTSP